MPLDNLKAKNEDKITAGQNQGCLTLIKLEIEDKDGKIIINKELPEGVEFIEN